MLKKFIMSMVPLVGSSIAQKFFPLYWPLILAFLQKITGTEDEAVMLGQLQNNPLMILEVSRFISLLELERLRLQDIQNARMRDLELRRNKSFVRSDFIILFSAIFSVSCILLIIAFKDNIRLSLILSFFQTINLFMVKSIFQFEFGSDVSLVNNKDFKITRKKM